MVVAVHPVNVNAAAVPPPIREARLNPRRVGVCAGGANSDPLLVSGLVQVFTFNPSPFHNAVSPVGNHDVLTVRPGERLARSDCYYVRRGTTTVRHPRLRSKLKAKVGGFETALTTSLKCRFVSGAASIRRTSCSKVLAAFFSRDGPSARAAPGRTR